MLHLRYYHVMARAFMHDTPVVIALFPRLAYFFFFWLVLHSIHNCWLTPPVVIIQFSINIILYFMFACRTAHFDAK